tara:strand:- start:1029 stop:1178 length:150 start_codon:yes stop_codon:yes gene_type:complete
MTFPLPYFPLKGERGGFRGIGRKQPFLSPSLPLSPYRERGKGEMAVQGY